MQVDWMKGLIIKTAKKGHFETAKTGMGILFNPTLSPTISLAASYYNESQLLWKKYRRRQDSEREFLF